MCGDGSYLNLINTETGKERVLSSHEGILLVSDSEIDYDAISKTFGEGKGKDKSIRYGLSRYSDFKNGLCAFRWTIYPDGMWFADSDGYGMQDNKEERAYCIMNRNFEILMPFRPVEDIKEVLKSYLKDNCDSEIEQRVEESEENTDEFWPEELWTVEPWPSQDEEPEEDSGELWRELCSGRPCLRQDVEPEEDSGELWTTDDANLEDLIMIPPLCSDMENVDNLELNLEPIQEGNLGEYFVVKLGEDVVIDLGYGGCDSDFWWELEFDITVFSGPSVRNIEEMGDRAIFKLKTLKRGVFEIRVMQMCYEPYRHRWGSDIILFDFNVCVRVI